MLEITKSSLTNTEFFSHRFRDSFLSSTIKNIHAIRSLFDIYKDMNNLRAFVCNAQNGDTVKKGLVRWYSVLKYVSMYTLHCKNPVVFSKEQFKISSFDAFIYYSRKIFGNSHPLDARMWRVCTKDKRCVHFRDIVSNLLGAKVDAKQSIVVALQICK